jgi:hypothetical protein
MTTGSIIRKFGAAGVMLAAVALTVPVLSGIAGSLRIETVDAEECVQVCSGVGYDCTTNDWDPNTGMCWIVTSANPAPQRFNTMETASESECDDLAANVGEPASWDEATGMCTIGLVYLGCFEENERTVIDLAGPGGRVLDGYMDPLSPNPNQSNDHCVQTCGERGFRYAGTQFGTWCFCGSDTGNAADDGECEMACSGSNGQICGGPDHNSIYLTHGSGGFTGAQPGYVGCYAEARDAEKHGLGNRVLGVDMLPPPNTSTTGDPAMDTATCTGFCSAGGHRYAATQYGAWCFCGGSYDQFGISSACTMACTGNPQEVCGGPYANSVYRLD